MDVIQPGIEPRAECMPMEESVEDRTSDTACETTADERDEQCEAHGEAFFVGWRNYTNAL